MTKADWLACSDPLSMMEFLRGEASDRKLRLFSVACCRRIVHLSGEGQLLRAVEASGRHADGLSSMDDVLAAWGAAENAVCIFGGLLSEQIALAAVERATKKIAALECAQCCREALGIYEQERAWLPWELRTMAWWSEMRAMVEESSDRERRYQANLLRCTFGSPFVPLTIDPDWLTTEVVSLAHPIYDDFRFDKMSELADVLEQSGCHVAEILEHCREPGHHARGCWVLDSILGKS